MATIPQDHRKSHEPFPLAEAQRLRASGLILRAVADKIGWSPAQTRRYLLAADQNGHHTAVTPTSHPEHTAVAPVTPYLTAGIPDIARQSDLDRLQQRVEVLEAFIATFQQRHTSVTPIT